MAFIFEKNKIKLNTKMKSTVKSLLALSLCVATVSCSKNEEEATTTTPTTPTTLSNPDLILKDQSVSKSYLAKQAGFSNIQITTLLSSEDKLAGSPDFVYGSMADGMGLMKLEDGSYSLINNIEAHYSVARISFDKTLKPTKGEYILNAKATANTAQCSGTLITQEEHGFGPLYLSGGEWGGTAKGVYATNPFKNANDADYATMLPALGQWSTENAIILGKDAYANKTVAFIGDDTSDDAIPSGQLAMYVGNRGDLTTGDLYGLKVTTAGINFEMDMKEGTTYNAEFVQYKEKTFDALESESRAKGMMGFSRVEDIDYRKGSAAANREIYFAVTGRKKTALQGKGCFYGRIYKVVLDAANPTKATITCVLDGDNLTGVAKAFHSPDNVLVTKNYVYIMEDPNGYPDTTDKTHFANLYQYNIATKELKVVLTCDQTAAEAAGIGKASNLWELTGMIDVSDVIGQEGCFLIATQNHGWENPKFVDPKGTSNPSTQGASQLYLIKGLER